MPSGHALWAVVALAAFAALQSPVAAVQSPVDGAARLPDDGLALGQRPGSLGFPSDVDTAEPRRSAEATAALAVPARRHSGAGGFRRVGGGSVSMVQMAEGSVTFSGHRRDTVTHNVTDASDTGAALLIHPYEHTSNQAKGAIQAKGVIQPEAIQADAHATVLAKHQVAKEDKDDEPQIQTDPNQAKGAIQAKGVIQAKAIQADANATVLAKHQFAKEDKDDEPQIQTDPQIQTKEIVGESIVANYIMGSNCTTFWCKVGAFAISILFVLLVLLCLWCVISSICAECEQLMCIILVVAVVLTLVTGYMSWK